jgi:hypothetical protein
VRTALRMTGFSMVASLHKWRFVAASRTHYRRSIEV